MILYNKHLTLIIAICFFSALVSNEALAQSDLPEFSLSDIDSEIQFIQSPPAVENTINIQRQLTKDILLLQEEINILTALITRQSEIKKMSENYEKVGIKFRQPLPQGSICRKIPVNLLCLYSYPDMDKNKDVVNDLQQRFTDNRQRAYEKSIADAQAAQSQYAEELADLSSDDINDPDIDTLFSDSTFDMAMPDPVEVFAWQDIRCLQDTCSTLIRSTKNPDMRIRLGVGESINDNVSVYKITNTGVKIQTNGEISSLKPLALDGNFIGTSSNTAPVIMTAQSNAKSSITPQEVQINKILDKHRPQIKEDEKPFIVPEPDIPSPTVSGDNLLGPTGLF